MAPELTAERKAKNESLFRTVNESIEDAARRFDSKGQFLCECNLTDCVARLELAIAAYEAVRHRPTCFLLALGHEDLEIERVVESNGSYQVVEKIGVGMAIAEATDPRAVGRARPVALS